MPTAKILGLPEPRPKGTDVELMQAAAAAAGNAHAPYSGFHVGAAVRSASGAVYTGVNVENVSYPVGTCAEAGAIAAARASEGRAFKLAAIAIAAFDASGAAQPCSPCGACRQRIVEFSDTALVSFHGEDGHLIQQPAAALLPHRFSFHPPGQ